MIQCDHGGAVSLSQYHDLEKWEDEKIDIGGKEERASTSIDCLGLDPSRSRRETPIRRASRKGKGGIFI